MKTIKKFFRAAFCFAIFIVAGIIPVVGRADNSTQLTINPNIPGTSAANTGVPGIVTNFYSFALMMAGILAFGAIVWGGIKYATGRGNPTAESEGKSWITNALWGLLLLAGAYVILYTINPQLVSLNVAGLPSVSGH